MYFYGFRGRQTQGPPRAAHTLATPLVGVKYQENETWKSWYWSGNTNKP